MLLCYEVTRDLPLEMIDIETPLRPMRAPVLAGKKLVLRADPARRHRLSRRHAESRAVRPRRPYRALSRSATRWWRWSITSRRRRTWPSAWSSSWTRCWRPRTRRSPRSTGSRSAASPSHPLRLPARRAGGHREIPRPSSRRADLDRGDRQPPQRARLHRARPRRCRRPDVRHQVRSGESIETYRSTQSFVDRGVGNPAGRRRR